MEHTKNERERNKEATPVDSGYKDDDVEGPSRLEVATTRAIMRKEGNLTYAVLSVSIIIILIATLAYAIAENWKFVSTFSQLFEPVRFNYSPIRFDGIVQAAFATIEIIIVGTIFARAIFPVEDDVYNTKLFLKIAALGFGFCITGLIITMFSDIHLLNLANVEISLAGFLTCVLAIQRCRLKAGDGLLRWFKNAFSFWKFSGFSEYKSFEIAGFSAIGVISIFIYYNAIMFPVAETDALIYQASAASVAFYNHGMPLIDGVGVGLGLSSNYPLLFSYIGTFYYLAIGNVQDVYLRAFTPTMWLLCALTTYLIGRRLASRKVGLVAAFLVAVVPSFASYGFQTTDETSVTFFVSLGFLFFVNALIDNKKRYYFLGAGIAFGAACLTSYQALYFIVPLGLLSLARFAPNLRSVNPSVLRNFSLTFLSTAIVGAAPYVRNSILLHDPVYPYFNNIFPAEHFSSTAMVILKGVSYSLVDPTHSTNNLPSFLEHLVTYASLYPLNLTLVAPSLALLWAFTLKEKRALVVFILIPSVLIVISPAPFVRYFWLDLPYAGVAVAAMIVFAYEFAARNISAGSQRSRRRFLRTATKVAVPLMLAVMIVFPTFVVEGGQAYTFIPFPNLSTQNYLRYTANPGLNASFLLRSQYGADVNGWNWLGNHVTDLERVATFEPRVYYMGFALHHPGSMFYLDGAYAAPLYSLKDTKSILQFMNGENISYVFVRAEDWNSSLFQTMTLSSVLGSPYFPLVFEDEKACVFKVGPITDNTIIQNNSTLPPPYALNFSRPGLIAGRVAENVTANSNAPRLLVENDKSLVSLEITYLDSGSGELDFNVFNPETQDWLGYSVLYKHDSNQWRDFQLIIPTNLVNNYTDFGLHAQTSNFTISKIIVNNSVGHPPGRISFTLSSALTMASSTTPESVMIYLPILDPKDIVSIKANTFSYNCSIDIFGGYIPLDENTSWWVDHETVAFSTGEVNPSLVWNVSHAGVFTVVIMNWDKQITIRNLNIQVSLTITGANSGALLPAPVA
ncbi:MAG: ArnT family glycosyltransferase [Nitrososphaerales archaeon]